MQRQAIPTETVASYKEVRIGKTLYRVTRVFSGEKDLGRTLEQLAVRRIFAMRASGTGFRAIAVTLNEEGVLPPGALYCQRKGRSDPRNVNHKWAETTVKALIRSKVYIGNMVQGKTGSVS